jgi:hypothetical protein
VRDDADAVFTSVINEIAAAAEPGEERPTRASVDEFLSAICLRFAEDEEPEPEVQYGMAQK